ncbi:MAG: DUF2800 domain-containing protein [Roseiarcus sp.]
MNADSHHTRTHARWAASSTARNVVCPGAIALGETCADRETEAAAWGTCAHQLAERCLHTENDAVWWIGQIEKSGKFEFVIDDEMANTAQTYVDYCRGRLAEYRKATGQKAPYWIEQRLSLDPLLPPLDAGGTADFVIYFPAWRLLEVVDLKGGRGVTVDVKGNPQGRTYGIGAMLALEIDVVDLVMVTIVQPRVGDGEPKSETFHVSELLDWTVDLLGHIARARQALDEFAALGGNRVAFDEWADKWLRTGQCGFCPAQAICPKRRAEALAAMPKLAAKWFEEPDAPMPNLSNAPKLASAEELARWLDGFDAIEEWIKSVRGHAHAEAERGVAIPGWQLVDKIGNRAWKDEAAARERLTALGVTPEQMLEMKFKSPAAIEKILGARRKAEIEPLVERPIRGTNLVAVNKTTRPAAQSRTERFNETLES